MFVFSVFVFSVFMFSVFAVAITSTATLDSTIVTFRERMSNDRCNGSSSKNECDGKFDLNHF